MGVNFFPDVMAKQVDLTTKATAYPVKETRPDFGIPFASNTGLVVSGQTAQLSNDAQGTTGWPGSTSNSNIPISANNCARQDIQGNGKIVTAVSAGISKNWSGGGSGGAWDCHIDLVDSDTGAVLAHAEFAQANVGTTTYTWLTASFDNQVFLENGKMYSLIFYHYVNGYYYNIYSTQQTSYFPWVGATAPNYYPGRNMSNNTFTQFSYCLCFAFTYGVQATSGVAITGDIPIDQMVVQWSELDFTKNLPVAGQTVQVDVLDTSNNVLKSNISSGQDLTDIDYQLYPKIRLKFTMTRAATTDSPPSLSGFLLKYFTILPSPPIQGTTYKYVSASTQSTSYVTVMNATGKGRLLSVRFNEVSNTTAYVRITIDGYAMAYSLSNGQNVWCTADGVAVLNPVLLDIDFNQSCKVEFYSGSASYVAYISVGYEN